MAVAGTAVANPPAYVGPRNPPPTPDDGEEPQDAYSNCEIGWHSSPTWTRSEATHPSVANFGDEEGENVLVQS